MATTTTSATVELVRVEDPLGVGERAAIAGFLAGYTGNTLISYTTDLRLFVEWCTNHDVRLFEVRRAHLEIFGRQMEADGRMRSTVARRLSTLGSFYRYCHVEGIPGGWSPVVSPVISRVRVLGWVRAFRRRDLLEGGGEPPREAERVVDGRAASPRQAVGGRLTVRASSDRGRIGPVDVRDVEAQPDPRCLLEHPVFRVRVLAELDDGVADSQLGVRVSARRRRMSFELGGVERASVEVDRGVRVADDQVGADRSKT
jgi:hypothetical protein